MTSPRNYGFLLTGFALILLPLVAWGFKFFSFGWYMVVLLYGPILLLLIGYVLQIVIAAQGFLSRRALFAEGPARRRATTAAWLTSGAFVLIGIFLPDGGDIGYGSTFQVWLGAYSGDYDAVTQMHEATDSLTALVAMLAAFVWIGAYLWLFVEWIAGLARRRRSRRAVAA